MQGKYITHSELMNLWWVFGRCFLQEEATVQPLVTSGNINQLHLVEELQEYCKPGYLLNQYSFADLVDLAWNIYTTYGTTEAATFAQHHNPAVGGAFFNSHMGGIHSHPPSTLPPIPPQPTTSELDDGISFLNAGDLDENASCNPDPAVLADSVFGISSDNPSLSDDQSQGDTLLYNNNILYCDLLNLYEFNTSVHDGDVSRTFEVIYVSLKNS